MGVIEAGPHRSRKQSLSVHPALCEFCGVPLTIKCYPGLLFTCKSSLRGVTKGPHTSVTVLKVRIAVRIRASIQITFTLVGRVLRVKGDSNERSICPQDSSDPSMVRNAWMLHFASENASMRSGAANVQSHTSGAGMR